MGKKRTEIIIETERIILIKRRSHNYARRCDWCSGLASTFDEDDSEQGRRRPDEPVQDNARGRQEVCPECGEKRFCG